MNTIHARLIRIGNSQGVRIPKTIVEQLGLGEEVTLSVKSDRLEILPASRRRDGWEQAFAAMAEQNDDALIDPVPPTAWEDTEWEW